MIRFVLNIYKSPEALAQTIQWLIKQGLNESFINVVIEAYVNKCSSVVVTS